MHTFLFYRNYFWTMVSVAWRVQRFNSPDPFTNSSNFYLVLLTCTTCFRSWLYLELLTRLNRGHGSIYLDKSLCGLDAEMWSNIVKYGLGVLTTSSNDRGVDARVWLFRLLLHRNTNSDWASASPSKIITNNPDQCKTTRLLELALVLLSCANEL